MSLSIESLFNKYIIRPKFWSEPMQGGNVYHLTQTDIETVKKNVKLPGDRVPDTPNEIIAAATNGVGSLIEKADGGDVTFFVSTKYVPTTEITMTLFVGLTEELKP